MASAWCLHDELASPFTSSTLLTQQRLRRHRVAASECDARRSRTPDDGRSTPDASVGHSTAATARSRHPTPTPTPPPATPSPSPSPLPPEPPTAAPPPDSAARPQPTPQRPPTPPPPPPPPPQQQQRRRRRSSRSRSTPSSSPRRPTRPHGSQRAAAASAAEAAARAAAAKRLRAVAARYRPQAAAAAAAAPPPKRAGGVWRGRKPPRAHASSPSMRQAFFATMRKRTREKAAGDGSGGRSRSPRTRELLAALQQVVLRLQGAAADGGRGGDTDAAAELALLVHSSVDACARLPAKVLGSIVLALQDALCRDPEESHAADPVSDAAGEESSRATPEAAAAASSTAAFLSLLYRLLEAGEVGEEEWGRKPEGCGGSGGNTVVQALEVAGFDVRECGLFRMLAVAPAHLAYMQPYFRGLADRFVRHGFVTAHEALVLVRSAARQARGEGGTRSPSPGTGESVRRFTGFHSGQQTCRSPFRSASFVHAQALSA